MRIVFVTNNYTPYSGGVVSSINASVAALHKAGHEVFIITLDFLVKVYNDPEYVFRIPCPLKFVYKKNPLAVAWRPYHHMQQIIQKLQPDIVHTHHPFYLGNTALEIAQLLSIPTIFTYHTIYEGYTHYVPLPHWLVRPIVTHKVISFCRQVNGIIAPSSFIQQHLQSYAIKTSTIVIPSGLQETFNVQAHQLKRYNITQPFQLLYVGRFTPEKNVSLVLDVMSMLHKDGNFCLKLVGYGAEYNNLCTYAYQTLNLSEQIVQFIHKPTKQELLDYYRQADLFLFPSHLDTQGLVLAEAMACGTPVVAVDGPGQRDIIQQGHNGFIVETKQAMAEQILKIFQDKELHYQLQEGAFETAKNYNPEILVERLTNFYADVLSHYKH